jgi:hypothetical protein
MYARINSEIKCINCRNILSNENLILSNYENKISTADQLKILDLIKG